MKILQVITSLNIGGAEKLIVEITERLRIKGYVVDVVLFNGAKTAFYRQLEKTGCIIYSLSETPSYYNPLYIWKLYNIIKEYDIIHTHNTSPQFFVAIANIFRKKILVTTEHNTTNRRRDKIYWRWIDKWMYNQYSQIICISDKAEENLRQYLRGCKTPIKTVYNGIDVEKFYNALPVSSLQTKKFVVIMVAAFRKQKDQKTLIRAISLLPKEEYELWLAGSGDYIDEVKGFVQSLGLNAQIKFLDNRADIPNILHTADMVCMSSHYEGLSLSNLEGMSVGKPFVATDVDGLHEVTKDAGILVPHEDAETLAQVIRKLHDDKEYYNKIAENCYQRALEFDIKKMIDSYDNIYQSLVNK